MKKTLAFFAVLACILTAQAQKKNFSYQFYGFVRGDLFYNTRANQAPVDGNFYLYPLDKDLDDNGKDINATPNGSFYTFTTRLGVDMQGPKVGKAETSAKVEMDFGGFSSSTTMLRIRQAYVKLDWKRVGVLIGQTWHPLFGKVVPDVLNLSTGAPFQPFNREPQIAVSYRSGAWEWTGAALWQLQYTSSGPNGSSESYLKNSCVPEIYVGADYRNPSWTAGIGFHLISLKPRTSSVVVDEAGNEHRYRVNERMTTCSWEGHVQYQSCKWRVAAKTMLASCLDHTALLGGYGISGIDPVTGEREYTPFRHSTSWINLTCGNRCKIHLYAGYTKNLGSTKPLVSGEKYGVGLDIDQLCSGNIAFSYNLPHWQFGVEYVPSTAWYGQTDLSDGKVVHTHTVTNHRVLGLMIYYF